MIPELDSLILTNMEGNHIPGLSACAFMNGSIVWRGAYGYADFEQQAEVFDFSLFMLASVSKTVTGAALMQLWEADSLELDDPINDYLPFAVVNPWHPDTAITFRMLLTHTSSIRDDRDLFDLLTVPGDSPIALGSFLENYLVPGGEYYNPALNYYAAWGPGEGHEYCNVAVALIGYLVEQITNTHFADYCREHIFDPLGMEETSWFLAPLDTTRVARPHYWNGQRHIPYTHYGYPFYPAGQLRTSAPQLAQFLTVFTEGGQGILDPETVDLMTSIHYPPDQGLIWFHTEVGGMDGWYHTGGHYGVSTHVLIVPEARYGSIILTNGEASTNVVFLLLWNYIMMHAAVAEDSPAPEVRLIPGAPNPVRVATTIRFELERGGPVILDVHDVSGRTVLTLLAGALPPGGHAVVFHAASLPSGAYFYRLQTGNRTLSRRCMVLR